MASDEASNRPTAVLTGQFERPTRPVDIRHPEAPGRTPRLPSAPAAAAEEATARAARMAAIAAVDKRRIAADVGPAWTAREPRRQVSTVRPSGRSRRPRLAGRRARGVV